MVFDAALLNTQQYKETRVKWINPGNGVAKGPLHLDVVAIEKGALGHPRLRSPAFLYLYPIKILYIG